MVEHQRVILRWVLLFLCLPFAPLTLADNDGARHWSEGIYFPAQTMPKHQAWGAYAARTRPKPQVRSTSTANGKYNPWRVRSLDDRSRQPTGYAYFVYPNRDHDPREPSLRYDQRTASESEFQVAQPSEFAAAEYYPKRLRQELHTSAYHAEVQNSGYGRAYAPQSNRIGSGGVSAYRDHQYGYHARDFRGGDSIQPPLRSHTVSEYPSQDYDPYARNDYSRDRGPVERTPQTIHRHDYAVKAYRPNPSLYESYPASSKAIDRYGNTYDSQPYEANRGSDHLAPPYGPASYPLTALNPFLMYGAGAPYIPYSW